MNANVLAQALFDVRTALCNVNTYDHESVDNMVRHLWTLVEQYTDIAKDHNAHTYLLTFHRGMARDVELTFPTLQEVYQYIKISNCTPLKIEKIDATGGIEVVKNYNE